MNQSLLELNRDILRKKANGKTIWQPRICCWYDDREFRGEPLPGNYKGLDRKGIYEKIGCSDRLYYFNSCLERTYDESVRETTKRIDELTTECIMETPVGRVNAVYKANRENPGTMPMKWWVENEEDLKVFMYIEEASSYSFNMETYHALYKEYARIGLPVMFLPRVNMQKMFIDLAGVMNTIYILNDSEDVVEEYFRVLSRSEEKMLKAVTESPIEWINYGDNLHCKILPPALFEKYVIPQYEKRGDILHKAGKFVFSHWDGDTKDFLPYAKTCYLDGIEAITPAPQGDVTLKEVKKALGNDIILIDGIAAILFNDTYPQDVLIQQTEEVLNLFEGQLILGISDEFPSDGSLDRIELVNSMVGEFNARH